MNKGVLGGGGALVAGWVGLSTLGNFGPPENPLPTLSRELTVEEVLAERSDRQAAAQEAIAPPQPGTDVEFAGSRDLAREFLRQVDFNAATLLAGAAEAAIFRPSFEERRSPDGTPYRVQNGFPRSWLHAVEGPVDVVIAGAIEAGTFEYGHLLREKPSSHDLTPGVLVWLYQYADGFVVPRAYFEALLSHRANGGTIDPQLQPGNDLPFWDARVDNLQGMQAVPALRNQRALAEHIASVSPDLCTFISEPRPVSDLVYRLSQPGGFTAFVTGNMSEDQPERIIDVIGLDIPANIAAINALAPPELQIPETVRVPVVFSYDRSGHITSIHPDKSFPSDRTNLARCGYQGDDAATRSASLASIAQGMHLTGLPTVPASGSLPFQARAGHVVFGSPLVHTEFEGRNGHRRIVAWEPLRIDFLAAGGDGLSGGYLGSYDLIEGVFYRLAAWKDANFNIKMRRLPLEDPQ